MNETIYCTKKEPPTMSTPKKLALAALSFATTLLLPVAAFAQERAANVFDVRAWAAVGAGLAIGLAVLGGALGQGRAAAAALEGISRNPGASARIQTPMILGLALIESLVLVAFVIALWLRGIATG
jgi:F-type H+-transporting ATPase subunit c